MFLHLFGLCLHGVANQIKPMFFILGISIAVFTKTKGGLIYEASFAGQKLKFKPYKN